MPRKSYSSVDREKIRSLLITEGLRLFAKQGMKNTNLTQIYEACHISKSFFYTFYKSKEELSEAIIRSEQPIFIELLRTCLTEPGEMTWKERVYKFFYTLANGRTTGFFVLTCEEHRMVFRKMNKASIMSLRLSQASYAQSLMELLEIPKEAIDPYIFFNAFHSILLVHNSIIPEAPLLVANKQCESTLDIHIKMLVDYIDSLSTHRRDNV